MSDNINNSNPFDPASLRLNQSFTDGLWVKKLLTTVRYATRTAGLCAGASRSGIPADTGCRHRGHREVYLATPDMAVVLPGEFNPVTLYTAIRGLFLWHVKLPGPDGKHNVWHRLAAEAPERAMKRWVRVTANMSLGAYDGPAESQSEQNGALHKGIERGCATPSSERAGNSASRVGVPRRP